MLLYYSFRGRKESILNNEIPIILKRNITAKKIKIYPISDLHVGSAECNMRAWESFIDKVKAKMRVI